MARANLYPGYGIAYSIPEPVPTPAHRPARPRFNLFSFFPDASLVFPERFPLIPRPRMASS